MERHRVRHIHFVWMSVLIKTRWYLELMSTCQTIIFYKDKTQLGQQIANLVKVHKSTFEIICDMAKFDHFHKYKGKDLEDLILKLEKKMAEKDLGYFCSQETIISLYDVLQRHGLGSKYTKPLYA